MQFSTKDKNNDKYGHHCAAIYQGAWWYKHCYQSNLNGLYLKPEERSNRGIRWYHWDRAIKKAEMKLRPAYF